MRQLVAILALLALPVTGCAGGQSHSEGSMRTPTKTDKAPAPIPAHRQGIISGDFIFVSGQGGTNPATKKLVEGGVKAETRQTFENIKAILEAAGSSMDKVMKCNVYLRDINDFAAM